MIITYEENPFFFFNQHPNLISHFLEVALTYFTAQYNFTFSSKKKHSDLLTFYLINKINSFNFTNNFP